jgi:hypothetical protein
MLLLDISITEHQLKFGGFRFCTDYVGWGMWSGYFV